jgi:DNA polymerase (family 10)
MSNKEIAGQFNLLAQLMELHGENAFKIRTYQNAYQNLRRMDADLMKLEENELLEIQGIGKAVAAGIIELQRTGTMPALEEMKSKTPSGILDVLKIKGLGPKKIALIWHELNVTSLGELEYACMENRLIGLKGFGEKTQNAILEQIAFLKKNAGSVLISEGLAMAGQLEDFLSTSFPDYRFQLTGLARRKMDVMDKIEIIGTLSKKTVCEELMKLDEFSVTDEMKIDGVTFIYYETTDKRFDRDLFTSTGPEEFVSSFELGLNLEEAEIFTKNKFNWVPPESREFPKLVLKDDFSIDDLIKESDVKGVIHSHSTWSDGASTIEKMAQACKRFNYEYLIMSDHSVSAFYANGLNEDRLIAQWVEIDALNAADDHFRIFKSIESDIIFSGELDYSDDFLKEFEIVIASIHSNLKMDEAKANSRLLKAIEHPATRILGHMTGRLLLGRPGYPIDHKLIIDACAANKVAIEINSNPHRLDIDWRWLPYAIEKGVEIAISPDAHNVSGILHTKYGVWMARKGIVPKEMVINTKTAVEFDQWLKLK